MPKESIYDSVYDLRLPGPEGHIPPAGPTMAEGLRAKDPPHRPGVHRLTPAEILGLWVDRYHPDYADGGYQRALDLRRIGTKIVPALRRGKAMPAVIVGLYDGKPFLVDGQQRAVAHLATKMNLWAVFTEVSRDVARQLYTDQDDGQRVPAAQRILVGNSVVDRYLQAAVGSKPGDNPWANLVSAVGRADVPIPMAHDLITGYVAGRRVPSGAKQIAEDELEAKWDPAIADELAHLLRALGDRKTYKNAFSKNALRGIVSALVRLIPDEDPRRRRANISRWNKVAKSVRKMDSAETLSRATLVEQYVLLLWNESLERP